MPFGPEDVLALLQAARLANDIALRIAGGQPVSEAEKAAMASLCKLAGDQWDTAYRRFLERQQRA